MSIPVFLRKNKKSIILSSAELAQRVELAIFLPTHNGTFSPVVTSLSRTLILCLGVMLKNDNKILEDSLF